MGEGRRPRRRQESGRYSSLGGAGTWEGAGVGRGMKAGAWEGNKDRNLGVGGDRSTGVWEEQERG